MPTGRHTIHTVDGHAFDFDDPLTSTISEHDIAHGLSNICRFGGQITHFYSVAEHACLVVALVVHHYHQPGLALAALHHDSAEAVMGDIPTPLKHKLGAAYRSVYREVEASVAGVVGVPVDDMHAGVIKDADALAMEIEACLLKPNGWEPRTDLDRRDVIRMAFRLVDCWPPTQAESRFTILHKSLSSGYNPKDDGTIDYAAPFDNEEQEAMVEMYLATEQESDDDDVA